MSMESVTPAELIKKGAKAWNEHRALFGDQPSLARIDLVDVIGDPFGPMLYGYDFSDCRFSSASLRGCFFDGCNFENSKVTFADLVESRFQRCSFRSAALRVSRLGGAEFMDCDFERADLSYVSAGGASFQNCLFVDTTMCYMQLTGADLSGSAIIGAHVYGTSAWEVNMEGVDQRGLIITKDSGRPAAFFDYPGSGPVVRVDSLEVAQFVNLLLSNPKVRDVIDTITSKVVLILGRFTEDRKAVLDQLRTQLGLLGYVPVLFDFDGPQSRDVTETVSTLAHLARFVVADLTDPKSVPHELATIIPRLPSVPIQPIIADGHRPYGMFKDLERYPWVLPVLGYSGTDSLARRVADAVEAWEG